MTTTSTPAERIRALAAEAEALVEAATPGEWRVRLAEYCADIVLIDDDPNTLAYGLIASDLVPADADLCAASRTLVPQLAAALRECVTALEELRADSAPGKLTAEQMQYLIGMALDEAAAAMEDEG